MNAKEDLKFIAENITSKQWLKLTQHIENVRTALARLEELEKREGLIADLECQRDNACNRLLELEEVMKLCKEFFELTTVTFTDNDIEVVFWKDDNYDYAKELVKKIKLELE